MFMRTAFKCYDFSIFMTITRREVQLSGFWFLVIRKYFA